MASARASVKRELLDWARNRGGVPREKLQRRFRDLGAWETGAVKPTMRQLEEFSRATNVPFGSLFLDSPPAESLPLRDFRSPEGRGVHSPSGNLLDTIYACQFRQDWYRSYAQAELAHAPGFVSALAAGAAASVATTMMQNLLGAMGKPAAGQDRLRSMTEAIEATGVLIMANGIVGSNTRRKLDPNEFRGFVLSDQWAPVIFLNAADSRTAQLFTLAHEFAHLLKGQSGVSAASPAAAGPSDERWCNLAAAAFLLPSDALSHSFMSAEPLHSKIQRIARQFSVSQEVVLLRAVEIGILSRTIRDQFMAQRPDLPLPKRQSGGNFYPTHVRRLGRRFATAVVTSAIEGKTQYGDALGLLGLRTMDQFDRVAQEIELA